MQKSKKKKKKKKKKTFLIGRFLLRFSISDDKKGGKSRWLCFFLVRREGKCKIIYKKKEKNFFALFRRFFDHFWSLVFWKR